MVTHLSRNWWLIALRGLFALLFGILVLLQPAISLAALLLVLSAYLLVDGISNIIHALRVHELYQRWWVMLLEGITSVLAGIIAFVWPDITAIILLYIIAVWAIATGVMEIAASVSLRQEIKNEWLLALSGILSVILGLALLFWPGTGILAVLWLIGIYSILFGVLLLWLGFRLRDWSTTSLGSNSVSGFGSSRSR